ncbi:MAG: hypothetical protein ACTSU2_16635 [Promethearchaeota archaeon]
MKLRVGLLKKYYLYNIRRNRAISRLFIAIILFSVLSVVFINITLFQQNNNNAAVMDNKLNKTDLSKTNMEIKDPIPSIKTVNCTIDLISVTPNIAYHGDNVVLYGYIEKFDGIGSMIPATNEPIYAVINDEFKNDIVNNSDSNGHFWLTIPILPTYDVYSPLKLQANTSNIYLETNCTNTLYVDVKGKTVIKIINDTNQLPAIPTDSDPGTPQYHFTGFLDYLNGQHVTGSGHTIEFRFGNTSQNNSTIYVNDDGSFDFYTWVWSSYDYFTLIFHGDSELSEANASSHFALLKGIQGELINSPPRIYQNASYVMHIRISASNLPNFQLADSTGSEFIVRVFGHTINVEPDSNGVITFILATPPNFQGEAIINIRLIRYNYQNITNANYENSISIQVYPPNPWDPNSPGYVPYPLIILGTILVAGIVAIYFSQKYILTKRSQREKESMIMGILERIQIIKILQQSGKIKESLVYFFKLFEELAKTKYNIEIKESQTSMDFAIKLVKEYHFPPAILYRFIRNIESVVYGGVSPTNELLMEIQNDFAKLFKIITGKNLEITQMNTV